MTFSLAGGRNLESKSELYPSEKIQYARASVAYGNQARTLRLQGSVGYDQYQIRDPDDPDQYQRDSIMVGARAAYAPIHHRWWIEGDVGYWRPLNSDPREIDPEDEELLEEYYREVYGDDRWDYRENQTHLDVEAWVGRKFGEKYTLEVGAEYDEYYNGLRDFEAILTRDLHNALALLRFRYWQRPWEETDYDYDVSFSLTFKLPGPMAAVTAPRSRVLIEQQRQMMLAEGDPLL
jgi:hypothetical protein